MVSQVVIALGGNVGNVKETFKQACNLIEKKIGKIMLESSIYRTEAWGKQDQPDFINQVIAIETSIQPEKVLELCLQIEEDLGRKRTEKWGKRIIDVDIIFYESLVVESTNLMLPHPLMSQRNFVLLPLAEILPDFIHPIFGKTITELKKACKDELEVVKTR